MSIRTAALCLASGALIAAHATPAVAQQSSHGSDFGVSLRAGTLGGGIEISKWLVNHIGARIGVNYFSLSRDSIKQTDVNYDVHIKLTSFDALVDLYPSARGSFHFTAGLITNPAKVTGTGRPTGSGTFTLNNHVYTAGQVGTLTGEAKFAGAEPYLGLGFGTAASKHGGVSFIFDLGAAIGKPKISLTATGAASNPTLQSDLNAQIVTTQKDADKLWAYPVLALGLMIKF